MTLLISPHQIKSNGLNELDKAKMAYLYLISTEKGYPVKIGVSYNPETRTRMLQGAHWLKLVLEKKFYMNKLEAFSLEKKLKDDWKDINLQGEWFNTNVNSAVLWITEMLREH